MFTFTTKSTLVVSAAALVAAQAPVQLSPGCQSAVGTVLANNDLAKCLDITDALVIATKPTDTSYVEPIANWVQNVCQRDACATDVLTTAVNNITSACSTDLQNNGIDPSLQQQISGFITQYYPTAREVICLKDTTTGNFCLNETLTAEEQAAGHPLTLQELWDQTILGGVPLANQSVSNINTTIACSACNQAAYAIIQQNVPDLANAAPVQSVVSQCGPQFTGTPTGITNGASGPTPTPPASTPTESSPTGTESESTTPTDTATDTSATDIGATETATPPPSRFRFKARALGAWQ